MVGFCCPVCSKEIDQHLTRCPHCDTDVQEFRKSNEFLEKLILALDQPEPSTAIQSVWRLGEIGDRRAVEPLKRLLDKTQDIYVRRAALRTLDELEESIR